MHGLALLGTYIVVALAGQAVGFFISSLVERTVPLAGLPVFLAFFFGLLVVAWPIAVALLDWLLPEATESPVKSRVV
jgi:hypothetical protein